MKKLVCFDFDDTLFHTPNSEIGRKIWKEKFGFEFPSKTNLEEVNNRRLTGWWGRSESISMDVFDIKLNQWVYEKYLKEKLEKNTSVILATGRLKKSNGMYENISKILSENKLEFDEVHLNNGIDTFKFKINLFEEKIKELSISEFTIYDDRQEHLPKFEEWASKQSIKITIIDVLNKIEKKFN
jgi:hypothetical protein